MISRQFIPVGQGFFVFADATGNVTFKNSHREFVQEENTSESVFQGIEDLNIDLDGINDNSPNTENPNFSEDLIEPNGFPLYGKLGFHIGIERDNLVKPLGLSFHPKATDAFDRGAEAYDISFLRNNAYWTIEDYQGVPFVIQGTDFNIEKEIPLGITTVEDDVTFKVEIVEKININANISIFLSDKITGESHEITDESFELNVEEAGVYESRFFITFKTRVATDDNKNDDVTDDDSNDDGGDITAEDLLEPESNTEFVTFQDNLNKQLVIQNNGNQLINTIAVYDVSGRLMFSDTKNTSDRSITYSTGQYSTGVYVVNILMGDNTTITKKIAINN